MKNLRNAKLFLKNNILAAYNCSNSSRNNPEKTLFTLPKSECTRKAQISTLNQKKDTPVQSQYTNIKSTLHRGLF